MLWHSSIAGGGGKGRIPKQTKKQPLLHIIPQATSRIPVEMMENVKLGQTV